MRTTVSISIRLWVALLIGLVGSTVRAAQSQYPPPEEFAVAALSSDRSVLPDGKSIIAFSGIKRTNLELRLPLPTRCASTIGQGDPESPSVPIPVQNLIEAAQQGDSTAIRRLLAQGADVNSKDLTSNTALLVALHHKHVETALTLLAAHADVSVRDVQPRHHYETALMLALQCGEEAGSRYTTLIRSLLAAGADVNARDDDGQTVLLYAARTRLQTPKEDVFRLLLSSGADPKATDDRKEPAMLEIASYDVAEAVQADRVQALLEHGLGVDTQDSSGKTLLMFAAGSGKLRTMRLLLERGARVTVKTRQERWTPLLWTCVKQGTPQGIALLLSHGADLHAVDRLGQDALALAVRTGKQEVARLLLDCGASLEHRDPQAETPLMLAAGANKTETVRLLLKRKASLLARDQEGLTPLMWAVLALRPTRADEVGGMQDLIPAACLDYRATIRLLVESGADLNAKDKRGKTAVMLAEETDNSKLAVFLKDLGGTK